MKCIHKHTLINTIVLIKWINYFLFCTHSLNWTINQPKSIILATENEKKENKINRNTHRHFIFSIVQNCLVEFILKSPLILDPNLRLYQNERKSTRNDTFVLTYKYESKENNTRYEYLSTDRIDFVFSHPVTQRKMCAHIMPYSILCFPLYEMTISLFVCCLFFIFFFLNLNNSSPCLW